MAKPGAGPLCRYHENDVFEKRKKVTETVEVDT